MGGSSGGGGGQYGYTGSDVNQKMLPWSGQVPPETYKAYQELLPKLKAKSDIGLTPEEKDYFTGQGLTDINAGFAGAGKTLGENLARSGARGGAVTEAFGNLGRSKVLGTAKMRSDLTGLDIAQKGTNFDRLMRAIALPNAPISVGQSGTGFNLMPKQQQQAGSS
jgi:hypothetical protein